MNGKWPPNRRLRANGGGVIWFQGARATQPLAHCGAATGPPSAGRVLEQNKTLVKTYFMLKVSFYTDLLSCLSRDLRP